MDGEVEVKVADQWKAIARYQVGTSHAATDLPCQDYASYERYEKYCIGAVSDGAGSRSFSEYGSRLAVDESLNYLTEKLKCSSNKNPFSSPTNAEDIFYGLISTVREKINEKAIGLTNELKQQVFPSDLACTLLVFVAFPEGVAAMQLGDGFIVVRDYGSTEYKLLFPSNKDDDLPVNYTTFITSEKEEIESGLQVGILSNRVSFICASTDGLEGVAINFATQNPYPRFFIPLEQYIQETKEEYLKEDSYITDFLKLEQLNLITSDDKTLLLCSDSDINPDIAPELTAIPKPTALIIPPTTTRPPSVDYRRKSNITLPSTQRVPETIVKQIDPIDIPNPEISNPPINSQSTSKKKHPALIYLARILTFLEGIENDIIKKIRNF